MNSTNFFTKFGNLQHKLANTRNVNGASSGRRRVVDLLSNLNNFFLFFIFLIILKKFYVKKEKSFDLNHIKTLEQLADRGFFPK